MTPNIDIQDGQVTGTLQRGQIFYWYNPNVNDVAITVGDCGSWCANSSYTIYAGEQYAQAQILANPASPYGWTETPNRWNTPGMPHTQGPIHHPANENKEVA